MHRRLTALDCCQSCPPQVRHVNESALELAKRLEAHPKISRVHYPGEHISFALPCAQIDLLPGTWFELRSTACNGGDRLCNVQACQATRTTTLPRGRWTVLAASSASRCTCQSNCTKLAHAPACECMGMACWTRV